MPNRTPWFEKGLQFECVGCGRCCRGEPGYVWVTTGRAKIIASALSVDDRKFFEEYTRMEEDRRALTEQPNGDCICLENGNRCRIYTARPVQCRTWPFWPVNLKSRFAWERAAKKCPGMNRGSLYTLEEILRQVREFKSGDI